MVARSFKVVPAPTVIVAVKEEPSFSVPVKVITSVVPSVNEAPAPLVKSSPATVVPAVGAGRFGSPIRTSRATWRAAACRTFESDQIVSAGVEGRTGQASGPRVGDRIDSIRQGQTSSRELVHLQEVRPGREGAVDRIGGDRNAQACSTRDRRRVLVLAIEQSAGRELSGVRDTGDF
ncbi:MAG: hypothetical protein H6752_18850 [Candidatus Omnitrophica bacterium]|nr:hypothetical protein [Candidatus Omnitrophota bacterium]